MNLDQLSDDDLDAHQQAIGYERDRREHAAAQIDQLRQALRGATTAGITDDQIRQVIEDGLTRTDSR